MIFADSAGFIAAFDRRDARHADAAGAWRLQISEGAAVVTTDLVLAETVTHLRRRAGWELSKRVGEAILTSSAVELVVSDADQAAAAWREFVRVADPKLSLCDALSFVIMRERGITRALTFDQHFADAGFDVVP